MLENKITTKGNTMMLSNAAKQRTDRLEKMARAAITQYNVEIAKGSEPLFPDWALELIGMIEDHERVLATLARQQLHLVHCRDFETNTTKSSVVQIQRAAS